MKTLEQAVREALLNIAARKLEHYEITGYDSLLALAGKPGHEGDEDSKKKRQADFALKDYSSLPPSRPAFKAGRSFLLAMKTGLGHS